MKSSSVLIVGCGDLGIRTGSRLLGLGWEVHGVRRNPDHLPAGFVAHGCDYTQGESLTFAQRLQPDMVLAIFNPVDRSESGYRRGFTDAMAHLIAGLGNHRPRHIVMTSSTRVFAEREGGRVDENSPLTTEDPCAQAIIDAERMLFASGHSASVVRFAGIYGRPGGRLLSRIRRGELSPVSPQTYTNRIHREDCGGFLTHLLLRAEEHLPLEPVYIGVDDCPAPRHEVESWLAEQMHVSPCDEARPADTSSHRRAGHRRCSNRLLHESGYALIYPDYKSGYRELIEG